MSPLECATSFLSGTLTNALCLQLMQLLSTWLNLYWPQRYLSSFTETDLFIGFRAWGRVMFPFDVSHLHSWWNNCFHQNIYLCNKSANIFIDSSWSLSSSYLWPTEKTMKRNKSLNVFRLMTFHALQLPSKEALRDTQAENALATATIFSLLRPCFIFQLGSSDNFLGCSLLPNQAPNSGEICRPMVFTQLTLGIP